jgi:hypothetical protein
MAFPKGFSPHRYHPGDTPRGLTEAEKVLIGTPCPHCSKPLVKNESRYSEYVQCPSVSSFFIDPENDDYYWRFKRLTVPTAGDWKSVTKSDYRVAIDPAALKEMKGDASRFARDVHAFTLSEKDAATLKSLEEMVRKEPISVDPKPSVATRKTAAPTVEIAEKGFPYALHRKMADAIQAAQKEGKIGSGFSLRREMMAARLWASAPKGFGPETAYKVAFALVCSERATDDERPFYEEVWRAATGKALYPLNKLDTPNTKEVWHPQAGLALMALNAGVPLWLTGEAGAGKTYLTRQLAKLLKLPYVRLQGSRDRTVDDVIGAWGYDPAVGSVFRAGVVVDTARNGGLLHIDEVAALPHEVTFELHAVLEGEPLTVLKNSGEVVALSEKFRMVANDNSVGEGEQAAYVGLHSTNLAFRDRWAFLRVEPMPETIRQKLVLGAATKGE